MKFASFLKLLNQTDDVRFGFLVFGCFSQVFVLLFLFFLFLFGLKFLHSRGPSSVQHLGDVRGNKDRKNESFDGCNRKKRNQKDGFDKKSDVVDGFDRKNMTSRLKSDSSDGHDRENQNCSNFCRPKCNCNKNFTSEARNEDIAALPETEIAENEDAEGNENDNGDSVSEDQIFDVITLRVMVKKERKRGDGLYIELEKERAAAASAAEEAMLMLMRLQSEKSAAEMEAEQYKRIAEQKQVYDQEVVQRLQWMVMKHEEERNVLEDWLKICVSKLKSIAAGNGDSGIKELLEGLSNSSAVEVEKDEKNVVISLEEDSKDF